MRGTGLRLKIRRLPPVRQGTAVCVPVALQGVSAPRRVVLMLRAGMVLPLWTVVRWRIVRL
ncbi:hypothetical protein F9C11_01545 [Amycolatopsis sp. VS8301801F10]|uniref:hypothetical protein n=1 Tax=Amycolatopsis sp. VS8301801F10 TaxID=2652442 RepID=UPI0038FC9A96